MSSAVLFHLIAFLIFLIIPAAIEIFHRHSRRFEIAVSIDKFDEFCHIAADFRNRNHRQFLTDEFPFSRIIVDKDKTLEAEVQLLRNQSNIFRFGLPVRNNRGKIIFMQKGIGMVQPFPHIFHLIFRTNCKSNSTIFQCF